MSTPESEVRSRQERIEFVATVLLSVSAVLAAWSAFQGARWNSVTSARFTEAGAARTESAKDLSVAGSTRNGDLSTFGGYVLALTGGDEAGAAILYGEFRHEFRPLVDEWLASDPLSDPTVPSPFDNPAYDVVADIEMAIANTLAAEDKAAEGRTAREAAEEYILMLVFFALVLFFAGLSVKFRSPRVQVLLLAVAFVIFAVALVVLIRFPVVI